MRSERGRLLFTAKLVAARFLSVPLLAAALLGMSGTALTAQVADSTARTDRHADAHKMAWGRETMLLSEVLEYSPAVVDGSIDYDLAGWTGGAVHRLWAKVDGGTSTRGGGTHGEYQLLYGRLVSPWWDAQIGVRVDRQDENGASATRAGAVVGLQGLAPGWFEVEPSLFVASDGNVSFDLTASYDLFLSQRLVLQSRLESAVSLRDDTDFGIGSGLVNTSLGVRTRFEIRREFAPYVGVVWDATHGRTARFARQAGAATEESRLVGGLRLWW
jgi:copper resistance protein B